MDHPTPTTSSPVPLLDLARENDPLLPEILRRIEQIIQSGQFVLGPACAELEEQIAALCQVRHAIGCASGSDALLLCMMASDIGPGDEVLVPSFTFFATASAVSRLGAKPVFVDIDPETFNLNVDHARSLLSRRTRAIMPVHLFGQCAPMDPINELARDHGLSVIEDCAQSIGALDHGRPCGSIGLAGCFSFYPTKNIGGFGDGGMVTTNDDSFADRVRLLRAHGMRPRYLHRVVGINSRLDSIQAAVLSTKLPHLKAWSDMRRQNAIRYAEMITQSGWHNSVQLPSLDRVEESVWNQFTIRVPAADRDSLRTHLTACSIGSEIYYPLPLHLQPCFAHLGYSRGSLPETERAANEVISLPIFPTLTVDEQQRVVDSIGAYFINAKRGSQRDRTKAEIAA